ncbi:single-stranded-DNA-specific exonuclease RecJ [Candidatus Saccharibacteria bacterium]|nr:single-stranded-DNA-specific exonuclease RecJ [Candidatus Saccharibacteria bacterium]
MNKLFIQLLKSRNLTPSFMAPQYKDLADPFILYDMDKAIERIGRAIKNREKILIYGDYDVDGVTASTVMAESLILAGVNPEYLDIMLPDRFADGYGMSSRLIERAKNEQATLVVTVDCGSRNHAIIDELNVEKIDTIVTDHHETEAEMPEAIAVINPHRKDHPTESLQNLAGVGVAFKLAQALVKKELIPAGQEKWLLDLVLLGTICDSMTLIDENRILSFYGMIVLSKTRRPGLKELMKKAQINSINTETIGFGIGPRLNAAGRLDTAELSLNLLRATSPMAAAPLAEKLEQLNQKRKAEQLLATREIKDRGVQSDPVIIETGKWHEGIIGIVAGRLVEDYHKPAFVLTETTEGIFKGSGRSFGDFNLAEALAFVKDSIISGGGHAAAAGVKVDGKNLYKFREQLNEYYRSLGLENQARFFRPHADLVVGNFSELTLEFLDDLAKLEPFGPGNEEPIFHLKDVRLENVARMGADRNHLRLDLKDSKNKYLKAVSFYAPQDWLDIDPQFDRIELLVKLCKNEFRGLKTVEARICDIIKL